MAEPASLTYTKIFADSYHNMPVKAQGPVDKMLDRLQDEHSLPTMRDGVKYGEKMLYATPRFQMLGGDYRIIWEYDSPERVSILCWTIADADRRNI